MGAGQLRDWALYLAGLGWRVFPIAVGDKKPPAIEDWENRASTDAGRINRCWQAGAFNIGIATGPSRLVVVDLDVAKTEGQPDGATAFAELVAARGVSVPDTYTVATPSGGRHLYFTAPPGVHLRSTRRILCAGVDTRAEGGYIVAPGSVTPQGGYDLIDDRDPAELPAWIVQAQFEVALARTRTLPAERPVVAEHATAYVTAALEGETERVRTAPRGQHNDALSHAAYNLGRLVGAGLLDHTTARAELLDAAQALIDADCDCTLREVTRVIDARLADGIQRPRKVRPDEGGHAA